MRLVFVLSKHSNQRIPSDLYAACAYTTITLYATLYIMLSSKRQVTLQDDAEHVCKTRNNTTT
ncbi:hypothetical protein BV22DRAFT_1031712 [Leucogyrophana mollusca]|uniref:Uncharacterized protein n=1 Tax=Leucogyrophana mollusca TaxID=85980 RepID=A0ACB8BNN2_9AGAM|nr:hypothetical protein BV22DRAFT_1031712 [Leucogyrophana mollusca]